MTECRLNIFLPYIHKSKTDVLDLSHIAKEFVSIRMNCFGNFYIA